MIILWKLDKWWKSVIKIESKLFYIQLYITSHRNKQTKINEI